MYTFDHGLFLWLNFDGGPVMDAVMKGVSTPSMWCWLYILILFIAWREKGWKGVLIFLLAAVIALGLSDMIAGVFKHSGLLKNLWPSFPARLRPMHTPELQDSIHAIARGGKYGTVSAHAATNVALAMLTGFMLRKSWLTWLVAVVAVVICYSRIYLALHFPVDIGLGFLTGSIAILIALLICHRMWKNTPQRVAAR